MLKEKAQNVFSSARKLVFALSLSLVIVHVTGITFDANAETTSQNCSGCLNNTKTQVLTIFNFQTESNPFLAGNATFIITPNPYGHTTNATDYLDLITWFNFVVTDDGQFDSDPMPGIIELVGINNGTYSIMQIKGSPGFGISQEMASSDDIFGTTGLAYVTQTFVNFTTTTSVTIEPPHISDDVFSKLKNTGGAKINGVTISSANDLPPAMLVTASQKLTASPPDHLVFTTSFAPTSTPNTLFTTLGIPTYSAPKGTSMSDSSTFMPPVFVAPVSGGGNFIMSPIIDEVNPGTSIILRFDEVDQGADHPLLKAIALPMNVQGTNVGISVKVDTSNPSGVAIPSGNVALFLDFEETGDIDFGDTSVYSDDPIIHFNVEKDGTVCPDGVVVYLLDSGHWHEVTPGPTRNPSGDTSHTCAYDIEVEHFSSYLVGSDSTGGHDHDSGSHDFGHDSHDGLHTVGHSHSSHAHGVEGHGEHESGYHIITKVLNIFEIEYDLHNAVARITVGTTGDIDDVEVQTYSTTGGIRMAHLIKSQQPQLFKIDESSMKKHVFEVPLDPNETFFRVSVEDRDYNLNQSVKIEGITGRIVPWFASIYENGEHDTHDDASTEHKSHISNTGFEIKFDGGRKTVSYNGIDFPIKYEMAGTITGIEVNEESKAVNFLLDSVSGGELLLQVPRSLIDALDNNFVVLVSASPQSEMDYEVVSSTIEYYTLKITLPEGANSLTIIGSSVVPEFGVLTVLVLIASIIGIIGILKTRLQVLGYN